MSSRRRPGSILRSFRARSVLKHHRMDSGLRRNDTELVALPHYTKQKAAHFWAASKPDQRTLVVVLFGNLVLVGLDQLGQFGAGHLLFGDGALVGNKVDDLVLEDGS